MTLDQLISSLESDAVERLTDVAVGAIKGAASWFITPFGAWVLGWIIKPLIKIGIQAAVKALDLGGYYLYKAMKNPADAEKYQDSVRDTKRANESGDKDAIKKAREEQKRRFAVVVDLRA